MNWTQFLIFLAVLYGIYYGALIIYDRFRARNAARDQGSDQMLSMPTSDMQKEPQKVVRTGGETYPKDSPFPQVPPQSENSSGTGGIALEELMDNALKDSVENVKDIFDENAAAIDPSRGT
ncbi:hypothetical protein [Sphingobacterium sp. JB170]|uniref:hypothetical protein n=1 Tax=Sphingobacterium sp. JB170 TaxID=1434842 RepID=UPI00097F4184|nr:hypothetical protein [Sphingobacterium sp. JB170]SJN47935.1 hypothetical protein FM107_16485 [Sphingobacterium sp. JB170]